MENEAIKLMTYQEEKGTVVVVLGISIGGGSSSSCCSRVN